MPKRRKETEEEYYIRATAEAKEAKKALAKKRRQDRNELINKVGKLFVDKCGLMSFEDYERICESDEFGNILSAYADSKNKPQTESLAACEGDANVSSEVDTYGIERGVVYTGNAVVQPEVDSYETESID